MAARRVGAKCEHRMVRTIAGRAGRRPAAALRRVVAHARFLVLPRADRLVPTLDLGINLRRTLRHVVIGPRCAAGVPDIRMLLASAGVAGIDVTHSRGTYR